ncbi:hypothetical protein [Desulfurobacterium sp. TC5-1]|uniref:hypothetical protein n=1 Tax=Desulfurobacterium sp. TC5-1 TaxID=1158318 RepID=UPI0003B39C03|nr:hypothetical protein [Desulfurobacterium sp. TC5-1]
MILDAETLYSEITSSFSSEAAYNLLMLMENGRGRIRFGNGFIILTKGVNKYFLTFAKGEERLKMEFFFPEFEAAKRKVALALFEKSFVISSHPFYLKKERERFEVSVFTVNGLESESFYAYEDSDTMLALSVALKERYYYQNRGFFITESKITFMMKEITDPLPFVVFFKVGSVK